jgi:hypothetical protein
MLTTMKVVGIGSATDFPTPDAHDSTQEERGHEPGSHAIWAETSVNNEFAIFSDTVNPSLARLVAHEVGTRVGYCVLDGFRMEKSPC